MNVKNIVIYVPIIVLIVILGYNLIGNQSIKTISTTELAEKLQRDHQSNEVIFIDVREPFEYEYGYIKGMVNIPLNTLKTAYTKIPKDSEVVLICRSGNRSMQAAKILEKMGYSNIVNVDGGIQSWQGELINK